MAHSGDMPHSDLLSSGDVASLFGVDSSTVIRWADEGKLPFFKTPGGHFRFQRSDVEAFLPASRDGAAS